MKKTFNTILRRVLLIAVAATTMLSFSTTAFAQTETGEFSTLDACQAGLAISYEIKNTVDINGSEVGINPPNEVTLKAVGYSKSILNLTTTVTVTLKNNANKPMVLSFSISGSNAGNVTVTPDSSGVTNNQATPGYSYTLEAGKKVQIKLDSPNKSTTRKASISNIEFYSNSVVDVTFKPASNSAEGAYSVVKSDGTTVAIGSGAEHTCEYKTISSVTVSPATGYVFVGWRNSNGQFIVADASTRIPAKPDESITVEPCFAPQNAVKFKVGSNYYFYWEDAFQVAVSNNIATVIVAENGTLPGTASYNKLGTYVTENEDEDGNKSVTYKIPAGKTLLIPHDGAYTVTTTEPVNYGANFRGSYGPNNATLQQEPYRTLTMASGAHITVEGTAAISVSGGVATDKGYNAMPIDYLGYVQMNSGSSITIGSGASLYAWGFIQGSGAVTIEKGGQLYEDLQIRDWRGGAAVKDLNTDKKMFPFSQYYVQNVQTNLTIKAGATQTVYTICSYGTLLSAKVEDTSLTMIGGTGAGLFRMDEKSGSYIVRKYESGRVTYDVHGDVTMSNISAKITVESMATITIDSSNFYLPVNNLMTINIHSGTATVSNHLALLPGAQMNISSGATVKLSDGIRMIVHDRRQWGNYFIHGNSDAVQYPVVGGTTSSLEDAQLYVAGTLDASKGFLFSTIEGEIGVYYENETNKPYEHGVLDDPAGTSGANICGAEGGVIQLQKESPNGKTYYWYEKDTLGGNKNEVYLIIPSENAWLKNSDGEYVKTLQSQHVSNAYTYTNGEWVCEKHTMTSCVEVDGVMTATCDVCGYVCTHPNGDTELVPKDEPTCTETGVEAYYHCDVCMFNFTDAECTAAGLIGNAKALETWLTTEGQGKINALGHTEETVAGYAATCTETGLEDGTVCAVCGEVILEQAVIPALGHTEKIVDGYVDYCPNYGLSDGIQCSVCEEWIKHREAMPLVHTYENLKCTGCGRWQYTLETRYSLELRGEVHILVAAIVRDDQGVAIKNSDLEGKGIKVTIEMTDLYGDTLKAGATMHMDGEDGEPYIVRKTEGIPAKDMGNIFKFCVTLTSADGTIEIDSDTEDYGVLTYAENMMAKTVEDDKKDQHDALKKMLVGLLEYGAAAENYFGEKYATQPNIFVKPTTLLNANIGTYGVDTSMGDPAAVITMPADGYTTKLGESYAPFSAEEAEISKALVLEGALKITYRVKLKDAELAKMKGEMKMAYWTDDANEATVIDEPKEVSGAYVYFDFPEIVAKEMGNFRNVVFYIENDETPQATEATESTEATETTTVIEPYKYCSGVITYSPEIYANNKMGETSFLSPLVKWMVVYGDRAREYFLLKNGQA